ncbi:MAG: hypothetical protein RMI94_02915 [Bryobacterales bacterium]|nr:hypothetical protein [Bryobacteraceae bacterium]MDW8129472.1 hypothetical protein [Bryobacterales bacterium]
MIRLPRNAQLWLAGYLRERVRALRRPRARRVWVAIADHFEPYWRTRDPALARERVRCWRDRWPEVAARHRDSAGQPPRWTFFYPEEEYQPELLEALAELARAGIADVEVHIHHDREDERSFLARMQRFLDRLAGQHGLLRRRDGRIRFGFVHGNWALDNSLPGGLYCGLNNEITLLRDLGCYADFTMPSAPSTSQARMVNRIYWAVDDPLRPKSYDTGTPAEPGRGVQGDLLIMPGPLGLRWEARALPSLENGEIGGHRPLSRRRVKAWLRLAPRLGDEAFLKLFTHGTQERHREPFFRGELDRLFELLIEECQRKRVELRFATAWQLYLAAERLILGRPETVAETPRHVL